MTLELGIGDKAPRAVGLGTLERFDVLVIEQVNLDQTRSGEGLFTTLLRTKPHLLASLGGGTKESIHVDPILCQLSH